MTVLEKEVDQLDVRFPTHDRVALTYVSREELRADAAAGRDWLLRVLLALVAVGSLVEPVVLALVHHR